MIWRALSSSRMPNTIPPTITDAKYIQFSFSKFFKKVVTCCFYGPTQFEEPRRKRLYLRIEPSKVSSMTPKFIIHLLAVASLIISIGCGAQSTSTSERTDLISLIKDGNTAEAIELINSGADVNARDTIQRTPLHAAARQNNTEVMELLISKGADLEATVVGSQVTPLFDTVMGGSKAVQLLLNKGANVEHKTPSGDTAAAYAIDTEIAVLLDQTADAGE